MEHITYNDPVDAYIAYLKRAVRNRNISLTDMSKKKLAIETAYSYGCTEQDFVFKIPNAIRKAESEVQDESL